MDPITIVGLVGTSTKLIQLGTSIGLGIRELRAKYADSDATLSRIEAESATIEAAIIRIKAWIESELVGSPSQKALLLPLHKSLEGCYLSLEALHAEITRFLPEEKGSSKWNRWRKIKLTLDDSTLNKYLDDLRWQANGMHVLLSTTTLPLEKQQKGIEDFAEATSLRVTSDESIIGATEFAFDDEIVTSAAYRRALAAAGHKMKPKVEQTMGPSSSSLESTLVDRTPIPRAENEPSPPGKARPPPTYAETSRRRILTRSAQISDDEQRHLQSALEGKISIEEPEKTTQRSPLAIAARYGDITTVEDLLHRGAPVFSYDQNLQTPLHLAADNNKEPQILELLVSHGANVNAQDKLGRTPFHLVAIHGSVSMYQSLMKGSYDANENASARLHFRDVPLYMMVGHYLRRDLQLKLQGEFRPIHLAALNGHSALVGYLSTIHHDEMCTIVQNAIVIRPPGTTSDAQVVEASYRKVYGTMHPTALDLSIIYNRENVTQLFIQYLSCRDSKQVDDLLYHGLHLACWFGQGGIVRLLFDTINKRPAATTDPVASSLNFVRLDMPAAPIHMAAYRNCPQILKMLQENGADAGERHPAGGAAHYAAKGGALASLEMLRGLGVDLDALDVSGHSPLSCAVGADQVEAVRYLLKKGCRNTLLPGEKCISNTENEVILGLLREYRVDPPRRSNPTGT